jgi:hypothetical protein
MGFFTLGCDGRDLILSKIYFMPVNESIKPSYPLPSEIDDEQDLQELQESEAEYATEPEIDILDMLTPEQYKELMDNVAESEKGNVLSWDEFEKQFNEWRTKFKLENPHLKE